MNLKIKNEVFIINEYSKTIRRESYRNGNMLFSEIDSGEIQDVGKFSDNSFGYKIAIVNPESFREELKCHIVLYKKALEKYRSLLVFK